MSNRNKIQKFMEDALLNTLSSSLGRIPFVERLLRYLLRPVARRLVRPAAGMLADEMTAREIWLVSRQITRQFLRKAREDKMEPEFQQWLEEAQEYVFENLDIKELVREFEQWKAAPKNAPYQNNAEREGADDSAGEEDVRETAVGKYLADEGKDPTPDGVDRRLAADADLGDAGEARAPDGADDGWAEVREELDGLILQRLQKIHLQDMEEQAADELQGQGWLPDEEDVRGFLKDLAEHLGLNLDAEKLSIEEMAEKMAPSLEKKVETVALPAWEKALKEEFAPALRKFMREEVWPEQEKELSRKMDRIFGVGDERKPQAS